MTEQKKQNIEKTTKNLKGHSTDSSNNIGYSSFLGDFFDSGGSDCGGNGGDCGGCD